MKRLLFFILPPLFALTAAPAGEVQGPIPLAELQALDRAIARELNSGQLGSQTLGDLTRLKNRLVRLQAQPASERDAALKPLAGEETSGRLRERLEAEAAAGDRAAKRSLALYYIFANEPEKALTQWRQMGRSSGYDLSYLLISSYLEFALGEYNSGRRNLETAMRLMDSRTGLEVSAPVFCTTIAGYRLFSPKGDAPLLPGDETLLYVEVEGAEFRSGSGGSECQLMFGLTLKDEAQATVWAEPSYGEYAPLFSGPIRDLHAALTWRVPNNLLPGRYSLHVEALESASQRRGEGLVAFTVAKRETNPETRPGIAAPLPRGASQIIRDANRAFPGAPSPLPEPLLRRDEEYYKQFDLLQQYEKNQRVEK